MKKLIALLLTLFMVAAVLQPVFAEESAGDSAGAPAETAEGAESDSGEESAEAPAGDSAEAPAGDSAEVPVEETAAPAGENRYEFSRFSSYEEVNAVIRIIPAEGDQVELGYLEGVTEILEVDGLKFKDMNKNGALDPYEDWRLPVDERVRDLYDQMDIYERSGLFHQVDTGNVPFGVDFTDPKNVFGLDDELGITEAAPTPEAAPAAEGESAESEGDSADAAAPAEDAAPAAEGESAESEGDSVDAAAEGESGEGEGDSVDASGAAIDADSMWYMIAVLKLNTLCDNSNGTPDKQVEYRNAMQAVAEETRLGIPAVFTADREYNAWGGMIDSPHFAFGTANDVELAKQLWTQYARESRAVGLHATLQPYGEEIGCWNGEDPEYIGTMAREEVNALQVEDGIAATMKHFIARGGDSSFHDARSDAQTVDNWMTAWRIALESNPKWVMTNGYNLGLTNTVHVDYDEETMRYLRETLGYDGIIVSDWGDQNDDQTVGVTVDGVDVAQLTIPERYAWCINLGLDQLGSYGCDFDENGHGGATYRNGVIEALQQGLITEERCYETCYRVLKVKFEMGLFENPYCDEETALALSASPEYIAERFEVYDSDTLTAARNPEVVELERKLEAESTILVKNDDNLLPLEKGIKVYLTSNTSLAADGYPAVFPDFCTLVDSVGEADVVVIDASTFDETVEATVEEAQDAGKKIVIAANGQEGDDGLTSAISYSVENADAVLLLTFKRTPDHGSSIAQYNVNMEPIVFAELLFGDREPAGMIVKEIGRSAADNNDQWKDLAGDKGVDTYVRLLLLALMKTSENNTTPENYGDPLICYKYGMRYGEDPEFVYDTLVLPKSTTEVTEETSSGTSTSFQTIDGTAVGEPFNVYVLLWNNGASGMTTVKALVDGEEVAEKIMAVNGGSWRIVEIPLVIDTAGTHEITVGDITKTITIE